MSEWPKLIASEFVAWLEVRRLDEVRAENLCARDLEFPASGCFVILVMGSVGPGR